jgi:hypothetical protein
VNIEVQERSSTFRQLLASLDVLSLTWKADLDANLARQKDTPSKEASTTDQLLSLAGGSADPSHGHTSTQAIDAAGARACKQANTLRVLQAVIAEGFYAVHSKAQKRVPVPDGVDLNAPIDSAALQALKNVAVPELQSLAALTFATASSWSSAPSMSSSSYFNAYDPSNRSNSKDEEDAKIAKLAAGWGDESSGAANSTSSSGFKLTSTAYEPVRNPESNLFYLGGSKGSQPSANSSLAQSLADFEDSGKKGKKKVNDQCVAKSCLSHGNNEYEFVFDVRIRRTSRRDAPRRTSRWTHARCCRPMPCPAMRRIPPAEESPRRSLAQLPLGRPEMYAINGFFVSQLSLIKCLC